jgi:Amt family ammonium transporter
MERRGMAAEWQAKRLGHDFRRRCWTVAITTAAGFVEPMPALAIGLIAGVVCYHMVATVKVWFGYDDSPDAFGVHGAGGTHGALLTGVFASRAINPIFRNAQGNVLPSGLVEGNARQLVNQLIAIGAAWSLAIVGTVVALKIVDVNHRTACRGGT